MTSQVTLVGNLTRDPELRFTPAGAPVVTFGVAVNRRWQNRDSQQWEEQVSFFNVTCWRDLAHNVGESLQKGARVIVTGRLDQRSWETQEGDKRSVVEVVADEVGPSLRWATATIARNERSDTSSGGGGGGDPWGGGQPAAAHDPAAAEEPFAMHAFWLWDH
jgi:single-strand DNA-binding protein